MSKPESIADNGNVGGNENLLHLPVSQLQELQGVLRNPVSGRQVMIPLTSKAFIIGSLQPDKDVNGDETLHIRNANSSGDRKEEFREITRKILLDSLEGERKLKKEAAKRKKPPASKAIEEKAPSTTALPAAKKPPPNNPKPAGKKQTTHHHHHARNSGPALPFFEIKEEIDDNGRVLRSEKKDVTKQLELVAKELQADEEFKAENPEEYGDNLDIPKDYSDEEVLNTIDDESNSFQAVTDQDFSLLSTRLDDLAKLEEEAEQKTEENLSSAMRIQGKAWNKGFLVGKSAKQRAISKQQKLQEANLKVTSKVPPEMTQPAPQPLASMAAAPTTQPPTTKQPPAKKATDQAGWSEGFLNSASSLQPAKAVLPNSEPVDERSRTVKFQANDEVKEIPRVGTQSVASLKKAPTPISPGLETVEKPAPAPTPAPARSFDSSVFNGIVKERPSGSKSTYAQDAKPKKKLSKFAQDRLQNK